MFELKGYLRAVTRTTIFFLSACLMGWAFYEPGRAYFAGMMLGTVVSLLNTYYLSWKVERFGFETANHTGKRVSLGFATRASLSVIAVILAYKWEATSLLTTVIGLMFAQLVILILGICSIFTNKSS